MDLTTLALIVVSCIALGLAIQNHRHTRTHCAALVDLRVEVDYLLERGGIDHAEIQAWHEQVHPECRRDDVTDPDL